MQVTGLEIPLQILKCLAWSVRGVRRHFAHAESTFWTSCQTCSITTSLDRKSDQTCWHNILISLCYKTDVPSLVREVLIICYSMELICPSLETHLSNLTDPDARSHPMLSWCWPAVFDGDPTSRQHWVNVLRHSFVTIPPVAVTFCRASLTAPGFISFGRLLRKWRRFFSLPIV